MDKPLRFHRTPYRGVERLLECHDVRTSVVFIGIAAVIAGGFCEVVAQAPQAPVNERRFDAASVKPTLSAYEAGVLAGRAAFTGEKVPTRFMGFQSQPGGRFLAGASLKELIAYA